MLQKSAEKEASGRCYKQINSKIIGTSHKNAYKMDKWKREKRTEKQYKKNNAYGYGKTSREISIQENGIVGILGKVR